MMNQDQLLQLIDSSLTFDTGSLLRDIGLFAMVSPDPRAVQNRFKVQGLTHCKDIHAATGIKMNPQHEFIIAELQDTERTGSTPLFIVLERTASLVQAYPGLSSIPLSLKAPLLPSASIGLLSESQPSRAPLCPYQAVASDEIELTPPTRHPSPSHELPPIDSASLATARALYTSTQSTSSVYLADDRFVGSKNLGAYADSTLNIKQIRPQSLSLFELAVLADTIHNYDPHYSTFKHQCFWFATAVCDVVVREWNCITVTGNAPSVSRDQVQDHYLPDVQGRWRGIKINKAEDTVSSAIASNFRKYLEEKENEVSFIFYPRCHLLKSRCR
jgi:hypothetical protein